MKFLCDVHIPYKLVKYLEKKGFESIHINKILNGSKTKDEDICNYADENDFIIITKDSDFRDRFFLKNSPNKIIKINLGNISNKELIEIFERYLKFFKNHLIEKRKYVEINQDSISYFDKS